MGLRFTIFCSVCSGNFFIVIIFYLQCLLLVSVTHSWYFFILFKTGIHWLDRRIVRKQLGIIPTYHYVQSQGKLMMQSRENGQKAQFRQFLDDFEVKYHISKLQIFLKNRFHSNWRSYLVLTSGQKPKKSLEPFLRKISKCLILG